MIFETICEWIEKKKVKIYLDINKEENINNLIGELNKFFNLENKPIKWHIDFQQLDNRKVNLKCSFRKESL